MHVRRSVKRYHRRQCRHGANSRVDLAFPQSVHRKASYKLYGQLAMRVLARAVSAALRHLRDIVGDKADACQRPFCM